MTMRKTQLGEQAKADVATLRAKAMADDLLVRYLLKLADNIREQPPADRSAILREAAIRITRNG